jgi:hypothetical protein
MKKVFWAFFAVIISSGVYAQTMNDTDTSEVQQVIVKLFDGIAEIDSSKIAKQITRDFLLLENGLIWNSDSLIRVLKPMKSQQFKRSNEFRFIRHEVKDKMAWTAYYNTAYITFNGQKREVNWLESAVLVKDSTGWKVKLLHSTVLTKPPKK